MDDVTSRSPSGVIAECLEELNRLHQATEVRRAGNLAKLAAVVAGLDNGTSPEPEPARDERARSRGASPGEPFIPTNIRRTTHGGQPGPAVRERLREEALSRGGW